MVHFFELLKIYSWSVHSSASNDGEKQLKKLEIKISNFQKFLKIRIFPKKSFWDIFSWNESHRANKKIENFRQFLTIFDHLVKFLNSWNKALGHALHDAVNRFKEYQVIKKLQLLLLYMMDDINYKYDINIPYATLCIETVAIFKLSVSKYISVLIFMKEFDRLLCLWTSVILRLAAPSQIGAARFD